MAADPKGFAAILILGTSGSVRFRVTIVSE